MNINFLNSVIITLDDDHCHLLKGELVFNLPSFFFLVCMSYILALQHCMSFISRRNISSSLNANPYQDLQEANKEFDLDKSKITS